MYCPYCGHPNNSDSISCEQCGRAFNPPAVQGLNPSETPASTPPPAPILPHRKKAFPWGWAAYGCGVFVLAVVALAFGAASLIKWGPAIGKISLSPAAGSTLTTGPFTISSVTSPDALAGPTLFSGMSSALNLNNDTDFQAPKKYTGTLGMDTGTEFSLGNGWCAKDSATLKDNLANIQYSFSIDGKSVDLSRYPTLFFTDDRGESCAVSGVNITPQQNLLGDHRFQITQHFSKALEDGIGAAPYPAGDVTFDFTIRFQAPTGPGLNG
jgi:hypothetical protein